MSICEYKRKAPKQFWVLWWDNNGKLKEFHTNDQHTGEKKAVLNNGTLYIDTRYAARHRLYWYLVRKELYG